MGIMRSPPRQTRMEMECWSGSGYASRRVGRQASRKGLEIPAEEKRPGLDGAPEDADDVGG